MPRHKDPERADNLYEVVVDGKIETKEYTTSEAQRKAMSKYEKSIDNIRVRLPKGYSAQIKKYLETDEGKRYQSINAFVQALIEAKIEGIADRAKQEE